MDEDIFKDMIDYGDGTDNTPDEDKNIGETRRIDIKESGNEIPSMGDTRRIDSSFESADNTDNIDDEREENRKEAFSVFENIPFPEDEYSYDFEYDDPSEDEGGYILPIIKPIAVRVIPLILIIALIIWGMTSENRMVKNYRHNFTENLNKLTDSMGISIGKDTPRTETSQSGSDGNSQDAGAEYKEVDTALEKKYTEDEEERYRTEVESEIIMTFDDTSEASFAKCGGGIVCVKTNYLCFVDKNGAKLWEKNISITDPILKSEGDYFFIAQKGGTKFALYKNGKEIFENTAENNILTGNVSANGDIVLVTDKPGYKGSLSVYNKNGDNAFTWSSGNSSIIAADISADSRRVAAALLNVDKSVRSGVYLFNIKKTDSYAQQVFDDSIIYDVDFKGDNLTVFSDTALIGMKISGSILYNIEYGDAEPAQCALNDNSDKLVVFTGSNIPVINIYNSRGKLKDTVSALKNPGFACMYDDVIYYSIDREIIIGKPSMKIPFKYTAVMDIKGIVPIDKTCFMVIYSNSVSVVKMKGIIW